MIPLPFSFFNSIVLQISLPPPPREKTLALHPALATASILVVVRTRIRIKELSTRFAPLALPISNFACHPADSE
jgi:hypothetical protein